jgi:hypothetical protein
LLSAWELTAQLGLHVAGTYENTAERLQEDARVLQQVLKIAEGRCLTWTDGDGSALALVSGETRAGDLVGVLHGSRTPVVVRRVVAGELEEVGYRVVGQCFVEGVMYGEAVTWREEEADTFVLV